MVKQMVIIPLEKTNRFDPSSHFPSLSYCTEQRGEARWTKDRSQWFTMQLQVCKEVGRHLKSPLMKPLSQSSADFCWRISIMFASLCQYTLVQSQLCFAWNFCLFLRIRSNVHCMLHHVQRLGVNIFSSSVGI